MNGAPTMTINLIGEPLTYRGSNAGHPVLVHP
jgi:hypothetical protein